MASVLILEDDPDMREMLQLVLAQQGHLVVAVDNGLEAVEQASRQAFDLIVADIRMKGMDGLEAIHRTKGYQPQIGTLVVSGFASPEETRRASELKVGAYLRKPFRMQHFLKVVGEQLRSVQTAVRQLSAEEARSGWLRWALGELSLAWERLQNKTVGAASRAGQLAAEAARELELDADLTEDLRVAAQLASVELPDLPPELRTHLRQIPSLAYALGEAPARERELLERAVRDASVPAESAPEPAGSEGPNSDQVAAGGDSLLALARALQNSHPELAAVALCRLRQTSNDPARAAQATLALAEQAEAENVEKLCREALAYAARLGPTLRAGVQTQAALLLYRQTLPLARQVLHEVLPAQSLLGLNTARSITSLLLARLGEGEPAGLAALLEHGAEPDYLERYPWLMGELLQWRWKPAELVPLLRAFPALVVQSSATALPLPAKLSLLEALEGTDGYIPEEILQQLHDDEQPEVRRRAARLVHRSREPALPCPLRVHSFGNLEVSRGQRQLDARQWKTRTTQLFFARLASEWGRPFHEDRLIDEFWPDSQDRAKRNLHWAVSTARACLRDSTAEPEIILRQDRSLLLTGQVPYWHDLSEFQRLQREAQPGDPAPLRQLCRLYRGPYLEGCYHTWAGPLRDQLEHQAGQAHLNLVQILLASGGYEEAVEVGQSALRVQPHRSEHYEGLMRAHLALGHPAAAVELYRRCEQTFRREFGAEPTVEMTRLYLQARAF